MYFLTSVIGSTELRLTFDSTDEIKSWPNHLGELYVYEINANVAPILLVQRPFVSHNEFDPWARLWMILRCYDDQCLG